MPQIDLNVSSKIFLPKFRPYIDDYSKRYEIYWGGRSSGKTFFIIQKLLLKGLKEKRTILLMRKATVRLKDSVWKELVEAINDFQLTPYFELNRSEYRATCTINGTEFKCLGLDEAEKIKGFKDISDAYLDEVTEFTQDDFELIDGTIRSKKYSLPLQIIVSFNPISKANWVYSYFGFKYNTVPPNVLIHHSTYLDNTHVDESYIARMDALKERNPQRYQIEALGEFASLDKLVFPYYEERIIEDTSGMVLLCGLDFGYVNDATAFMVSYLDETNKILYVADEHYEHAMLNDKIAATIIHKGYGKEVIVADSAEQKSIEEIKRLGVPRIRAATKGPGSVLQGIQQIQQYKLVVNPKCENLIIELQNYSWKKDKKTNEYINEPIDDFNHCIDAMRYGLQCARQPNAVVFNKSLLGL